MKLRAMIVDDEEVICIVLKKMFAKRDVECVIINSYKNAIEKLGKEKFDFIVTDRWLNGVDGTYIIDELKSMNKKIPVIIMTGSEKIVGDENKYLAYINKPFEFSELEKAINRFGIFF
jgi:DNA-binding NtrC family response regulator